MRFFYILLFGAIVLMALNCKKDTDAVNSSLFISWKNCADVNSADEKLKICFDSLLQDSRCPRHAVCIWQGTAVVRFNVFVGHDQHDIVLSTLNLPGLYNSDTTLMGYKIEFVNLFPYPDLNTPRIFPKYKAEIKVTKQ